ncbi:Plasmodium exported protein (Pm-fam-a like), unknown function [Plasmodium malariae]|nr:Plasmodium exported protein (Pm-fam-a like), unknown function [Plasmodium malariae]
MCGNSIDKKYTLDEFSRITTDRILSRSSLDTKSTDVTSNDKGDTKLKDEKKNIYENSEIPKPGREKVEEILLENEGRNRLPKRKKTIFTRMDEFFEKMIFSLLGPIDIIKYNLEINNKIEGKTVNRKMDLGISPPYLVFLAGFALFIISIALVSHYDNGDVKTMIANLSSTLYHVILIFLISVVVLSIFGFIYVSIKKEKYEKIRANNSKICYNILNYFYKKYI